MAAQIVDFNDETDYLANTIALLRYQQNAWRMLVRREAHEKRRTVVVHRAAVKRKEDEI
jgi:hypothetical protein